MNQYTPETLRFRYNGMPVCLRVHAVNGKLDYVGRQIKKSSTFWEIEHLQETLRFLRAGDVVFDCGSNIGNHAVFWGIHRCKVYAFEPNPDNFKLLVENTRRNHCNSRNINALLGEGSEVRYRARRCGTNMGGLVYLPHEEGETAKRLDDICFIPVRLVKIDVEGAEMRVLRGMERILQTFHPVLFAEYHVPVATERQILRFLNPLGYRKNRDVFLIEDHISTTAAEHFGKKGSA